MSARRFTDKPDLAPGSIWGLDAKHPAMVENRTLFPSTVVDVTKKTPDRLLISGKNNRKLGETVEKGKFKGYALYQLSLEERATCPSYCEARSYCYGNTMQLARRHRIKDPDVFYDRLGMEIAQLCDRHPGILVRLHVLGDFPDAEYVGFWIDALNEYPNLACYGYTHRKWLKSDGDETGIAIAAAKKAHPDRFRIRWSQSSPAPDAALVIDYVPKAATIGTGIVCPAQTDASACCATCGLCWEVSAKDRHILFMKHGKTSHEAEAAKISTAGAMSADEVTALRAKVGDKATAFPSRDVPKLMSALTAPAETTTRPIIPITLPGKMTANTLVVDRPDVRMVRVEDMLVEGSYQRNLSSKSMTLIRQIVTGWDWLRFKPPIVADAGNGKFFVIDGQHTAIGAVSHPQITALPCVVVDAASVDLRAMSFVSHNRDRIAMTEFEVFHGEVVAGVPESVALQRIISAAGARVPRYRPPQKSVKSGDVTAIRDAKSVLLQHGEDGLRRVVSIAHDGGAVPIARTIVRGVALVLFGGMARDFKPSVTDADVVTAVKEFDNVELASARFGAANNMQRYRACATLIVNKIRDRRGAWEIVKSKKAARV